MSTRLSAGGRLIDTNKQIRFRFNGKHMTGFEGDTLASALLANDQRMVGRSFKYHRPRGPLSLAGHDANTLIQTPTAANRLAEDLMAKDQGTLSGQNYLGSLKFDYYSLLDRLGRFLPVGFYYRAFFKPRGMWRFWENVIRNAAGLGVANLEATPRYTDKQYLFCDVAVIGAGPAGLMAAEVLAAAGHSVLIADAMPSPARKFLMAGKSGLNLTKDEPLPGLGSHDR